MTMDVNLSNDKILLSDFQVADVQLVATLKDGDVILNPTICFDDEKIEAELKCENHCFCVAFSQYQALEGKTPIKGVDYFTETEIREVAKKASELVQTGGIETSEFLKTSQVGKNLEIDKDGKLNVVTTDTATEDNTNPITASAVYTIVGNIDVLLSII